MSKYLLHLYWGTHVPGEIVELTPDESLQLVAVGLAEEVIEDDATEPSTGLGGTDHDVPEGEADNASND